MMGTNRRPDQACRFIQSVSGQDAAGIGHRHPFACVIGRVHSQFHPSKDQRGFRLKYIANLESAISARSLGCCAFGIGRRLRVSYSAVRRDVSDSAHALSITDARARPNRSRGTCFVEYDPDSGASISTSGQLSIALYGLPSLGRVRSTGASTLPTPLVDVVFRVERRTRLCHSSSRRGSVAAVQRRHGCPAQLDGQEPERRTSTARIHGLLRGRSPGFAQSSAGARQYPQGAPA